MDHCTFQNSDFYGSDAAALRFYNSSPAMSYCTISGQSNSWSGIRFAQGSTGSFTNGTIQNLGAGHGIIIQGNSSPTIGGNTIQNVYYYGVIINGNGTGLPDIYGNTFEGCGTYTGTRRYGAIYLISSNATLRNNYMENSRFGIACDYGSSPTSGNLHPGGNIITNNDYGILAYNSSNPVIGLTRTRVVGPITYYDGACNKIYGNANYDAYATSSAVIGAKRNWWGSNPPNSSKFYTSSATIQYSPWSEYENDECWENGGPLLSTGGAGSVLSKSSVRTSVTPDEQSLLDKALDARFNGDYSKAVELYESALDGQFGQDLKGKALSGIFDIFRDSKDASLIQLIESYHSLYASQGKDSENLEKAASQILTMMYSAAGRYSDARNMAQNLKTKYVDLDDQKFALTQLALLGGFSKSEGVASQSAINEMKKKFASEVDAALLVALGVSPSDGEPSAAVENAEGLSLSGYPNPFNPSAKIQFNTVKAGLVSLKVYDALGREVATLVNATQQPGMHTIVWSANDRSSGVYFFRLSVAGQTIVKKMLLLK